MLYITKEEMNEYKKTFKRLMKQCGLKKISEKQREKMILTMLYSFHDSNAELS